MIEGKANIKFGKGDILITPLVRTDLSRGCVVLQNQEPHEIGEHSKDFLHGENDTVISFTNTKSIDVLIERLEVVKGVMNGEVDTSAPTMEYDY